MPAKKKATAKETASAKSEGEDARPPKFDVREEIEVLQKRLELLETTVDAIRREYKSKGIPLP